MGGTLAGSEVSSPDLLSGFRDLIETFVLIDGLKSHSFDEASKIAWAFVPPNDKKCYQSTHSERSTARLFTVTEGIE